MRLHYKRLSVISFIAALLLSVSFAQYDPSHTRFDVITVRDPYNTGLANKVHRDKRLSTKGGYRYFTDAGGSSGFWKFLWTDDGSTQIGDPNAVGFGAAAGSAADWWMYETW